MNYQQAMVDATLEVFAAMTDLVVLAEAVVPGEPIESNLTSCIGLAGDLKGTLAVHCPADVALGITSALLGIEVAELGEEAKDAIGEIVNMIAGGLKGGLAAENKHITLAIPTTVIGRTLRTGGQAGAIREVVNFSTSFGRFTVEHRFVVS